MTGPEMFLVAIGIAVTLWGLIMTFRFHQIEKKIDQLRGNPPRN